MKPLDLLRSVGFDDAGRGVELFQSAWKMHYGTGTGGAEPRDGREEAIQW